MSGQAVGGGEGDDRRLRDPAALLASPGLDEVIDLDQPAGVVLASVLHFVEAEESDALITTLTRTVVPGSYLILSAGTSTGTGPALIARARTAYAGASAVSARPEPEIRAWFRGWCLAPPGLVDVRDWDRAAPTRPPPAPPPLCVSWPGEPQTGTSPMSHHDGGHPRWSCHHPSMLLRRAVGVLSLNSGDVRLCADAHNPADDRGGWPVWPTVKPVHRPPSGSGAERSPR